jgi:hypothetical protein
MIGDEQHRAVRQRRADAMDAVEDPDDGSGEPPKGTRSFHTRDGSAGSVHGFKQESRSTGGVHESNRRAGKREVSTILEQENGSAGGVHGFKQESGSAGGAYGFEQESGRTGAMRYIL